MSQENLPLVSVVIPCYNHEKFVIESIESILNQSYLNIELLVIDDGSTDNSYAKIESLNELCVKRFSRYEAKVQENIGLTATLNKALKWCKGEFIIIIASDDVMLKDRVEKQVNFLSSNIQYYACSGSQLKIDESSKVLPEKEQTLILKKTYIKDKNNIFRKTNNIYSPTTMFRTKDLLGLGGYKEDIFIEDLYIFYKAAISGLVHAQLPEIFTYYRVHGENNHKRFIWMHENKLKILKALGGFEGCEDLKKLIILEGFYSLSRYVGRDAGLKLLAPASKYFYHPYFLAGLLFLLVNK